MASASRKPVSPASRPTPPYHQHVAPADSNAFARVLAQTQPERFIPLTAQVGIRYSLTNPNAYA